MSDQTRNEVDRLRAEADETDNRAVARAAARRLPIVGVAVEAALEVRAAREMARLEQAVSELADELQRVSSRLAASESHDAESLAALFEDWTRRAQTAATEGRRVRLVRYMRKVFEAPVTSSNFDERSHYLDLLDKLTDLDSHVLAGACSQRDYSPWGQISGAEMDAYVGSVQRLRSLGLLASPTGPAALNQVWQLPIVISPLGRAFVGFSFD